jgi:hypothetical protein
MSDRKLLMATCAAGWIALVVSRAALAQEDSGPLYSGAGSCARCHETPSTTDVDNGATARACLTEWQTWKYADRHAKAYDSLMGVRGQQMARLLGVKVDVDPDNVLAREVGCVQCHTTSYETKACVIAPADACVPEGVGCESCHGPSSKWRDEHWIFPTWRNADPQVKAQKGWIDVRSPVVRA